MENRGQVSRLKQDAYLGEERTGERNHERKHERKQERKSGVKIGAQGQ